MLSLTDLFYENPQGDTGTLTVQVGDRVLFSMGLANFRDLADHFVSPLVRRRGMPKALLGFAPDVTRGSVQPSGRLRGGARDRGAGERDVRRGGSE